MKRKASQGQISDLSHVLQDMDVAISVMVGLVTGHNM